MPDLYISYRKLPQKRGKDRLEMPEDVRKKCVELVENKLAKDKPKDNGFLTLAAIYFILQTGSRPREAAYAVCKHEDVFKKMNTGVFGITQKEAVYEAFIPSDTTKTHLNYRFYFCKGEGAETIKTILS